MAEEKQSIYVGSAKTLPNNGLKISVCLDDIPNEHKKQGKNGKTYVNLVAWPKKESPDQYGNTHSVKIDVYEKP